MTSSSKMSLGALMRLIVLVALELALFQDVWFLVIIPPITMAVLAINLGLFFVLARPRSWETRIIGMLLGSVWAIVAIVVYYLTSPGLPGPLGRALQYSLINWAGTGPAAGLLLAGQRATVIEGALLDLLGIAMIGACGAWENWARAGAAGEESRRARTSPLRRLHHQ
jgi:hypothetical protein